MNATATATINYYVFDEIKAEGNGCFWGKLNGKICEVFPLSSDDTEEYLIENGFAKCDAPGTETFVVEESCIEEVNGKIQII